MYQIFSKRHTYTLSRAQSHSLSFYLYLLLFLGLLDDYTLQLSILTLVLICASLWVAFTISSFMAGILYIASIGGAFFYVLP